MNSKAYLMPLIILIVIIFTAGVIVPEIFTMKSSYAELKKAEKELDLVNQKIEKAENLSKMLAANVEKQNILMRYIPLNAQEEDAINNLDRIVYAENLALLKLSPADKNEIKTLQDTPVQNNPVSDNTEQENPEQNNPTEMLEMSGMRVSVAGTYEKIKSLLEKIKGMHNLNKIVALKISKIITPDKDNATSDLLQADMAVGFGYMKKVTAADVNSEILDSGKFNMSIIDKINQEAKTNFVEITPGQTGKINPFIP